MKNEDSFISVAYIKVNFGLMPRESPKVWFLDILPHIPCAYPH